MEATFATHICPQSHSSLVHPHETNDPPPLEPWEVGDEASLDSDRFELTSFQKFRHGGWLHLRAKMRDAMESAGSNAKQLNRFDRCGRCCAIYASESTNRTAIMGEFCKSRCCAPCAAARSALICSNLATFLRAKKTRFLTLTLRHSHDSLSRMITRIYKAFKEMRASEEFQQNVCGGVSFLECKWSSKTKCWHVHLHCIIEGQFWEQKSISRLWHECTGDSFIVDIRPITDARGGAYYGAKYASKPFDAGSISNPSVLADAVQNLARRRLWIVFGEWKGKLKLLDKPDSPGDWEFVCTCDRIFDDADRQIPEALKLIEEIRNSSARHGPSPPSRASP